MERVSRTDKELTQALEDHLGLLIDAITQAKKGNFKYIKIIASTLRVLVHEEGRNTPLLISLAEKYSTVPIIKTNEPKGVVERPLNDFLQEIGFASGTQNIRLTNASLIAKLSQQEGGAHEDLSIEKDLLFSKGGGLLIGGMPPLARKFIGMGECVYISGMQALALIKEEQDL